MTEVILYYSPMCFDCKRAERYLEEQGIDYEKKNVDDPDNFKELKERAPAQLVPTLIIDGKVYQGFSNRKGQIAEALGTL